MTMIDTGHIGAKRQSWRQGNPRELLKRLIDELGSTDRERLFVEFIEQAFAPGNRPILESIAEYWFSNNLNSLLEPVGTDRQMARARNRARTEQVSKQIVERLTAVAGQLLLDLTLPHGKTLKDSTGTECLAIGGWLKVVGSKMKPDDLVGAVFSEDQLRLIFEHMGQARHA